MACGADIFDVTLCRVIQHVLLEDQNIPYARVQNRAGNFVLPGQANFSTLGAEFTLPQSVTSPDWVSVVIGNSSKSPPAALPFSISWGICSMSRCAAFLFLTLYSAAPPGNVTNGCVKGHATPGLKCVALKQPLLSLLSDAPSSCHAAVSPDTYPLAGLDFFIINQNSRYMGEPYLLPSSDCSSYCRSLPFWELLWFRTCCQRSMKY